MSTSSEHDSLEQYSGTVNVFILSKKFAIPHELKKFLSHCINIWRNLSDPFNGLFVSMYWGFFFAYLFLYAFSNKTVSKLWFVYFLPPAFFGLVGASTTNIGQYPYPVWHITISNFCMIHIFGWYILARAALFLLTITDKLSILLRRIVSISPFKERTHSLKARAKFLNDKMPVLSSREH